MKVFISHKREDSVVANRIAAELRAINVPYYLDLLDSSITRSGKDLTDHIKQRLNDCTDILVIISEATRYSQWVPFEVGMSAQIDMPTVSYLQENVSLPEFLEYWPRLKNPSDIAKYVAVRNDVSREFMTLYHMDSTEKRRRETERFYTVLKERLSNATYYRKW